jgi:transcriptional regulator with XRE-family HTH domain
MSKLSLGRMLKAARAQRGLEQTDVARLSGIERTRLSRIESGKMELKLTEARRLSEVLHLELDALIDELHATSTAPPETSGPVEPDDLVQRIRALDPEARALVSALVTYLAHLAP